MINGIKNLFNLRSINASVNYMIAHPPPGHPRAFELFSLSLKFPGPDSPWRLVDTFLFLPHMTSYCVSITERTTVKCNLFVKLEVTIARKVLPHPQGL